MILIYLLFGLFVVFSENSYNSFIAVHTVHNPSAVVISIVDHLVSVSRSRCIAFTYTIVTYMVLIENATVY